MAELLEELLSDYRRWLSVPDELVPSFAKALRSPTRQAWLSGCHQAVQAGDRDWLEIVCDAEKYPLRYLDDRGWEEKHRIDAAVFISLCARAALLNKEGESDEAQEAINAAQSAGDVLYARGTSALACGRLISHFSSAEVRVHSIATYADFPAVDKFKHKQICRLHIEKQPGGEGRVFRDPATIQFSFVKTDFIESINTAAEFIRANSEEFNRFDYTWRVCAGLDPKPFDSELKNKSVGLAAAIALSDAARGETLGKARFVFSGQLDGDGSLLRIGDPRSKIEEAQQNGRKIIIPGQNRIDDQLVEWVGTLPTDSVIFAKSFIDATETLRKRKISRVRKQLLQKLKTVGAAASIVLFVLLIWAVAASVQLRTANNKLAENEKVLTATNTDLEDKKSKLEKNEEELKDANVKLKSANDALDDKNKQLGIKNHELGQKNSDLGVANQQLDVARRNEESQRKLAEKNEDEAKFQRSVAEKNEETARAFEQVAKANQLAYQGLSFLNDKDYVSAQTYFAQSLSYNDTLFARSGLVNATYRSPLSQEFKWSLDQRMTSGTSAFEVGAEAFSYRLTSDSTGEYFAYRSDDREISVRKVQSKEEIAKIAADGKTFDAISLSPGGKFLAFATSEGEVFLRDVLSQKQEKILTLDKAKTGQDGPTVTALAFSLDSTYLAIATASSQIVVTDVRQRTIVNNFPKTGTGDDDLNLKDNAILNLVFNSSAGLAFSTIDENLDSKIGFIPNVRNNTALTASSDRIIINIAFTNDQEIISSGMGWETWLANGDSIKRGKSEDITAHIQTSVAANRHFGYFISAGEDGKLKIWNSSDKRLIAQVSPSMGIPIHVTIGDNGAVLIQSVTRDGKLRIFCWSFGQKADNHQIPTEAINAKSNDSVSYAGNYVKFDCSKKTLHVMNYFTGETLLSVQYNPSKDVQQLIIIPRLSRDGKRLLVNRLEVKAAGAASSSNEEVYNLVSQQSTEIDWSKYRGATPLNSISDACFDDSQSDPSAPRTLRIVVTSDNDEYLSDDGNTIAVRMRNNAIGVFSVNDPKAPVAVIPSKARSAFSISSNSKMLIVSARTMQDMMENTKNQEDVPASDYPSFELFDVRTGELKEQIPSPEMLSGYSLSPDDRFFAVTDLEGYVSIWTLAPYLRLLDVLKVGKYERALSPTFSQDSNTLAWISGGTGRIHFYDLRTQKRLGDLQTDDLVIDIRFVDANKLSIQTPEDLHSVDLNNLPMILARNALDSKTYIHALTNLYLDDALDTGFLYDQPRLDSILKASKYSISSPSVRGRAKQSAEITEFDKEGIDINQGVQSSNRQGNFDCNPTFSQPIFNPYPITFNDDRPACGHYALIDIRNASRGEKYSRDQKAWESVRQVKPGEVYNGLIYMSNGAANDLNEATIHDVRAKVTINYGQTGNNFIKGELLAHNAMPIVAAVTLNTSRMRPVVANTIEILDYQNKLLKRINVSDSLHVEGGQKMSFEIPIGDLKPGFATDLFIKFRFFFEDASRLPDQGVDKYTGIITDEAITQLVRSFSKSNIGCHSTSYSPVFNPFQVSFNDSNEECTDFPLIQGKLFGGSYPENVQELADGLTGHDGDIVEMLSYFDNGAGEGLDRQKSTISGFKVSVMVDMLPAPFHTVTVTLQADNAPSLSRSVVIHTDPSEQLEIIPKSGMLYDFQKNPVQTGFDVGNRLLSMQNLLPGFGHSGFIGFKIKIVPKDTGLVASCDRAELTGDFQTSYPETSAWFEWGETRELGKVTAKQLFKENGEYSQKITGLAPNTTYYYTSVVRAGTRRVTSDIKSFRTPGCLK